jgi:8-amino-7-oxononanoate synthase
MSSNRLFGLSAAKDKLLKDLASRRQSRDGAPSGSRVTEAEVMVPTPKFEELAGYRQMKQQRAAADTLGIPNPFFRVHEGASGATCLIGNRQYINFSSYNYLDLAGHPRVAERAKAAIDQYGTSASASRVVSGEKTIHRELEAAIAKLYEAEDCVVFVSGHATNVSVIGHLFGPKDLVLHDALIHNSALQGALLSGARRIAFPHNDHDALERILKAERRAYDKAVILLEGHYSMDGDCPDLARFVEVKRRWGAWLMVDEAHSVGVLGEHGRGIFEAQKIDPADIDIWMGTLSKTLSGCGGYICGSAALVEYLKFSAPGFVYSVGMSPPVAGAVIGSLEVMQAEPWRVKQLNDRTTRFRDGAAARGFDVGPSTGMAIVPIITGSSIKAARLAAELYERGVNVQPILYPAVPEKAARLRFFISSAHTEEQIDQTLEALTASWAAVQAAGNTVKELAVRLGMALNDEN